MTTPEEKGPETVQETAGLRPESAGGAGMGEEGAPIGFGAEVGGVAAPATDDPEEARALALGASDGGPTTTAERAERGEPEDDVPRTG